MRGVKETAPMRQTPMPHPSMKQTYSNAVADLCLFGTQLSRNANQLLMLPSAIVLRIWFGMPRTWAVSEIVPRILMLLASIRTASNSVIASPLFSRPMFGAANIWNVSHIVFWAMSGMTRSKDAHSSIAYSQLIPQTRKTSKCQMSIKLTKMSEHGRKNKTEKKEQ